MSERECKYCNGEYHTEMKAMITRIHSCADSTTTIEYCDYCPKCGRKLVRD